MPEPTAFRMLPHTNRHTADATCHVSNKLVLAMGLGYDRRTGTGGASGIGQAVAQRLREDRYAATLDLSADPSEHSYIADVTDLTAIADAPAHIRGSIGPITILVNAAGMEGHGKFAHIDFASWTAIIDVNLHVTYRCI
ncbi:SDR family oxidoreductase [Mycobacterium sp. CBMA293]|uniref:SDR family NAD(P)-dependent oxidoreductase n=1 Tax=unclassified Mycolicibacterium TaxID=2636767 RepID=UPI0012DF3BEC|nr:MULTISPECIES: SDR family NAD(P)-dependent oxidoreductase [unclassified Mycolicibacterium]MUL49418.1 SDR family oxidoreductase [Mycolicibacterium sp. CBMA 360]MUL62594.1 SDR family oxidoreductase [Mycolicibacterium sp. CBMA 335]MUL69046.1 SDR family oxidoreductase [Mycolicibacterium sp. CBMA 311]MUL96985.1 SDR family oxidoreductase [Mycolicibacterium sp. CBMA 230]MUM03977.1 hypothetical protein [Mycolicibacterium sp. CBMA 213]